MFEWRRLRSAAVVAGPCAVALTIGAVWVTPQAGYDTLRERAFDITLLLASKLRESPQVTPTVVVVDINSATIEKVGPWPWPRERLATLAETIWHAGPAAVAVDILFEGQDARSPASLARRLGADIDRPDISALAEKLPDGDQRLANVLARIPVALGFALAPASQGEVPPIPIVTRGAPPLGGIWQSKGAVGPPGLVAHEAAGMGSLALPGDADGVVRRVPLFVGVDGRVHPGLALEAVRLALGSSAYQLDDDPPVFRVGNLRRLLPNDGFIQLAPSINARTVITALSILEGALPDAVRDAIVIVGSSAPESGGLRPTPDDSLTSSVVIQAAAVIHILAGIMPRPIAHANLFEGLLASVAIIVAILAAALLRPLTGAFVAISIAGICWVGAVVAAAGANRLINPLPASALALVGFASTAIVAFAETHRRERRIRQRFEQHLAPQIVDLIASDPSLLKLQGQRREITALFTDVEDFTATTHRAGPEKVISVLDDYFEGIVKIIITHGGMIDKLVGDAVHALFNAPINLPDHPLQAVRCAVAIQRWTEAYRQLDAPASLGFGRTRIGIETGDAIVGDVGIRSKLDYTAHGDAVNCAARFEAANKELGSSICIGPRTAARCDPFLLRPIAEIELRGLSEPVSAFEPWPEDADASWRTRYLAAVELAVNDPGAAAEEFAALAAELPHDPITRMLVRRYGSQHPTVEESMSE